MGLSAPPVDGLKTSVDPPLSILYYEDGTPFRLKIILPW